LVGIAVGELIRGSEAYTANWYTLTLQWFGEKTKGGQKGINPKMWGTEQKVSWLSG